MVGVPRSSGCSTCVKRRVKVAPQCDERAPGCVKCEKYGKPCPGYNRGFKFITGKPYRSRRVRPDGSDSIDGKRSVSTSPSTGSDSQSSSQEVLLPERPSTLVSADLNVLQSLGSLIVDFSQPVSSNQNHFAHHWFGFLPSIYGLNHTLDATIKSFVAHHYGKTFQDEQMVVYARSAYGEALHRLRKALTSPSECFSTYIFCAVVLLCIYELFTDNENPESWMKHAKGLGQLIRVRGPDRYRNQLDITLLKASRGLVVMHSMFSGEQCFLASEEWHHMMQQQYTADMPTDLHNSIEQFFALFTYAPSLVHKFYSLKEVDLSTLEAQQTVSATLTQALAIQSKLAIWHAQYSQIAPHPVEIPSSTEDEVYPAILVYEEMIHATIYCAYYAYMAIIHETLKTFGYPGPHGSMVIYFCDQICKSVEYSGVGALGPFRLGFPLRVAYEVSGPLTRSWILTRLESFSKIYAAARPENYEIIE
ncbi:zinc-binding alcohol dehydrogenase-like protein [Penicillium atrosanguineum]|uniref:zinc-binding alcohol dehydrogenase-like protein n=1 Tax=Penicillium atrosanguineum TaxID=1132637 RepID=UPI00238E5578|nr:zinc-binding alcohol dehydrogenase-like protein [Penicillium atrosanguineum]KAJ5289779.1 zinc-binding alcohol dehydrogenase-like protein [Penicillium atrosanguineum]